MNTHVDHRWADAMPYYCSTHNRKQKQNKKINHAPKSSSDILRADELPAPLEPLPASGSLARASKRSPAAADMAAGDTPPAPAAVIPGAASDEPARRDETALIRPDSFCTQNSNQAKSKMKESQSCWMSERLLVVRSPQLH
jgi:hypothetical protein